MDYFEFQTGKVGKPITHNSDKAICHIMCGCGKEPVLAIDRITFNFLLHLGKHHLEQYAELIEAQEKD